MPTPLSHDDLARIQTAIFQGKKLDAIRHYRKCTGQGLGESRDFVEALYDKLRGDVSDKFQDVQTARGCTPVCIGIGLLLFSAFFPVMGIQDIWPRWHRSLVSQRAAGTVSEIVKGSNPDAADTLLVEFQAGGKIFRIRHLLIVTPDRPFAVGQAVSVLYEPSDPSSAMVDTLPEVWPQFLMYFLGPGLLMAAIGVAVLWWRARMIKQFGSAPAMTECQS